MKEIYRTTGIYRITNKNNGMTYIGKTPMNFGDRWDSHRAFLRAGKHSNQLLQEDWSKYGEGAFEFAVVEHIDGLDEVNCAERKYIAEYKSLGLAYNVADGGDAPHNLGKHLSPETKRKIGEKNRVNMLGRKASDETRAKMSAAQRNRAWTDEQRKAHAEKSRETNLGRVRSEDTRELLRKINQENPPSAKLTPDDVRDIRRRKADGETLASIADRYNSTPSYISSIVHGRRWGHIQ